MFISCKDSTINNKNHNNISFEDKVKPIISEQPNEINISSFEGEWEWLNNPNKADIPENLFTLKLEKTSDNEVRGQYCAIAQSGNKIDCTNDIEFNIKGNIKDNKIDATFYSFFDIKKNRGNIELSILNENTIKWKIIKDSNSEFYAPKECILIKKNKIPNTNKKNSLPFDFEEYKNSNDQSIYKAYNSNELPKINELINSELNEYPISIYIIDNENLSFQTYIIETNGDSVSQILINIKDGKILASKSIGYELGGEEVNSYNTFIINKDLSIITYEVNNHTKLKKTIAKLQIKQDGSIVGIPID